MPVPVRKHGPPSSTPLPFQLCLGVVERTISQKIITEMRGADFIFRINKICNDFNLMRF